VRTKTPDAREPPDLMLSSMFCNATGALAATCAATESAGAREVAANAASAMDEIRAVFGVYPYASAITSSGRAFAACVCGAWMAWRRTIMHATRLTSFAPFVWCRTPFGAGRKLEDTCAGQ
jgi:hypothetical protein